MATTIQAAIVQIANEIHERNANLDSYVAGSVERAREAGRIEGLLAALDYTTLGYRPGATA